MFMQAPIDMYLKFKEYRQKFTNPPSWKQQTLHEFWRPFVDGKDHALNLHYFYLNEKKLQGFLDKTREELLCFSEMQDYIPLNMREDETLLQAYHRLNAWVPYERREKNYLKKMLEAWSWMNLPDNNREKIDAEFIKNIHKQAVKGVLGTNFDSPETKSKAGNFRAPGERAYIRIIEQGINNNTTASGLEACFATLHEGEESYSIQLTDKCKGYEHYILRYDSDTKGLVLDDADAPSPVSDINRIQERIRLDKEKIQQGILEENYDFYIVSETKDSHLSLEIRINHEINLYYAKLEQCDSLYIDPEENLYHKLVETIKLTQLLCRMHPFVDGNTRTLGMLLFPYLLKKLGLGDVCIFDNPNRMWLYSVDELVKEVLKALENAQHVTNGTPCALTVFSTESIVNTLDRDERDYYFECLEYQQTQLNNLTQQLVSAASLGSIHDFSVFKPGLVGTKDQGFLPLSFNVDGNGLLARC